MILRHIVFISKLMINIEKCWVGGYRGIAANANANVSDDCFCFFMTIIAYCFINTPSYADHEPHVDHITLRLHSCVSCVLSGGIRQGIWLEFPWRPDAEQQKQ